MTHDQASFLRDYLADELEDPATLLQPVAFAGATRPLVVHLTFVANHSIHYRGQLSANLRAMGAFVPGVFGRSADERSP